jgi:aspartokinase
MNTQTSDQRERSDVAFERDRGVTHLSVRRGVSKVAVHMDEPHEGMGQVFHALSKAGVNVYLIKLSEDRIEFALDHGLLERTVEVLQEQQLRYSLARHCALVSVVAPSMRDLSGVLWRFMGTLREAEIEVLELSDAYNAVSCLIPEQQLERAAVALSEAFEVELSDQPKPLDPW